MKSQEFITEQRYAVYAKGGTIGDKGHDKPIKTFDSREDAMAYAKRRRAGLSKGEKGYYKMGYSVKPLKESSINETNELETIVDTFVSNFLGEPFTGSVKAAGDIIISQPTADTVGWKEDWQEVADELLATLDGRGYSVRYITPKYLQLAAPELTESTSNGYTNPGNSVENSWEDVKNNHPDVAKFIAGQTGSMTLEKYGKVWNSDTNDNHVVVISHGPSAGMGNTIAGLNNAGVQFSEKFGKVNGVTPFGAKFKISSSGQSHSTQETWEFYLPNASKNNMNTELFKQGEPLFKDNSGNMNTELFKQGEPLFKEDANEYTSAKAAYDSANAKYQRRERSDRNNGESKNLAKLKQAMNKAKPASNNTDLPGQLKSAETKLAKSNNWKDNAEVLKLKRTIKQLNR